MALFGKMFEKKYCAVCGEEIKLLGNRKLSDGNLCKNCASKLSPWFSERRQSTVDEIKEQLEYRKQNEEAVQAFECTRTLGQSTKVLLDENNMKFIVTSSSNYRNSNPDVLDFSMVTGCNIDVDENKTEIRKDLPDGKHESYNPPQYDYSYNIYVTIFVNHPYFNEMKFKVNSSSIDIENPIVSKNNGMHSQPAQPQRQGMDQQRPGMNQQRPGMNQQRPGMNQQRPGMNQQRPGMNQQRPGMNQQQRPGMNQQRPGMDQRPDMRSHGMQTFVPDPQNNVDFQNAQSVAYEIKDALTQVREDSREQYKKVNEVKMACTCPYCGATTTPDANGCCEYCGGAIEG